MNNNVENDTEYEPSSVNSESPISSINDFGFFFLNKSNIPIITTH